MYICIYVYVYVYVYVYRPRQIAAERHPWVVKDPWSFLYPDVKGVEAIGAMAPKDASPSLITCPCTGVTRSWEPPPPPPQRAAQGACSQIEKENVRIAPRITRGSWVDEDPWSPSSKAAVPTSRPSRSSPLTGQNVLTSQDGSHTL